MSWDLLLIHTQLYRQISLILKRSSIPMRPMSGPYHGPVLYHGEQRCLLDFKSACSVSLHDLW